MQNKVQVTLRALLQRIDRRLRKQTEMLKKARGREVRATFGQYYTINTGTNFVQQYHVDPVALATELRVLQPWETVQAEDAV